MLQFVLVLVYCTGTEPTSVFRRLLFDTATKRYGKVYTPSVGLNLSPTHYTVLNALSPPHILNTVSDTSVQTHWEIFTFMLPCIVIISFLNNQPDAPIIQIYSLIKLYMFRASSLPIIRSFLLYIRHQNVHPDSAWKRLSKPAWNLPVPDVQYKTPDDGHIRCPKHVEFYNRINLDN